MAFDWGRAVTGAISGATTGSAFGPWGAVTGGVVGGAANGFTGPKKPKQSKQSAKYGAEGKPYKLSTMDKYQKELMGHQRKALYGKGPLAGLYNSPEFNPEQANEVFDKSIANPAYRKFNENIIPDITGQFRNQGLQQSSYVGGALGNAGRDVQESLDAQRGAYIYQGQRQAEQDKMTMNREKINDLNNLQNRQTFAYAKRPPAQNKPASGIDSILESLGPQAADYITKFLFKGGGSPSQATYNDTSSSFFGS